MIRELLLKTFISVSRIFDNEDDISRDFNVWQTVPNIKRRHLIFLKYVCSSVW